ncbi:MAG: NAD kinase [Saprospiraceae bacterium]|nr:NAD kinase [Saprospiraceae bacterium]MCB9308587.1 NAD kinase [Lewinellaceae bacterium]
MNVLIYGQGINSPEEYIYVDQVFKALKGDQVEIIVFKPYIESLRMYDENLEYKTVSDFADVKKSNIDLMITLGGDGTILKAVTLIHDLNIPILGINLGRLGFLASVEKKIISTAIKQVMKKDYTILRRSMLQIESNIPIFQEFPYGLNDFTINRRDTSSMITVHVFVDDELLNSYWADGLIVSTPTGSTGYALSCGGPIVLPDSKTFIITPVAPHNLNVRPIVLPDYHAIKIQVEGRSESFMCTLDSRYETISAQHQIILRKGSFDVSFIQLKGQTFMKTLGNKLHWGKDKRN